MKIKNLHRFLIIKYTVGGIITLLLFSCIFLIYSILDTSLNENDKILQNLSSIRDSVRVIKTTFNSYINEPQVTKKNLLKQKLDELVPKLKNNANIKSLSHEKTIDKIEHFSKELKFLRLEIQNIIVQYRSLSLEIRFSKQQPYLNPIKTSLINIEQSLSNLNAHVINHQRGIVADFGDYNILIWLASLLSLHIIIIFIFKPVSKTILSVVNELNHEKDEARASAKAKSDYLATLSHQIRTPLNGVLGLSGLLLETNVNKEQREDLELVRDSGENLLQVINDIFNYSKIEAGQLEVDEMLFSVYKCLDDLVDTFLPKCREKKIELLCIIEFDVPDNLIGDSQKLTQCLSKLINNSIKFTRSGEILIRVNVMNSNDNKYEIQFSISDTGIGIPEAKMKSLFNPLPQSEAPVSRRFEGTGLGLAIVSRLVHLMNGRIWVESEMNKGTTFYMAIHFTADKQGASTWDEKDLSILLQKHILILDPSENNRNIISLQCHDWGMQPRSLQSEDELFKILAKEPNIDFIFIDYESIRDHFSTVVKNLESLNSSYNFQVIYMVSSITDFENEDVLFLHKPIRKAQLLNLLLNASIEKKESGTDSSDEPGDINEKGDLNILLAEDNVINQKLLERMISRIGYQLDIAQDGNSAVSMASKKKYDLIFMDLQMPELDGLEATKTILKNSDDPKPKVIAMTANVTNKDKELCFEAGMIDYLAKPVNYNKIKTILDHWYKQKFKATA